MVDSLDDKNMIFLEMKFICRIMIMHVQISWYLHKQKVMKVALFVSKLVILILSVMVYLKI
jgi:hypothetical protein